MSGMKKSQKTLMVIDDEETDRALIREILQREGYDVAEADGYHSSLRLFAQIRDSVSLLIADVALGDGNGCDRSS